MATGFRRFCVTAVWGFLLFGAYVGEAAFVPPHRDSVKALKVTKGRPFSSGVVFVDGKFIEPPYVVERYGNVLRVNKIQITNPVVDWSEFLKTQDGVVVTKTEVAPAPAAEEKPEPVVAAPVADDDDDPLADLFDDAPAKQKKASVSRTSAASARTVAPKVRTELKLEGGFVPNARSAMLVNKINAARTEIDLTLRKGGFFCFGSRYSKVCGDKGAANRILQQLPKIMKDNSEYDGFVAALRKAGFVYFPPNLVRELFDNRVDYLMLQRRWKKVLDERAFNAMLEDAGVKDY